MKRMNGIFAALALAAASLVVSTTIPADAQYAPSGYQLSSPAQVVTYRATKIAFGPASSATDFLVIQGSASKQINVRSIKCDGISTANATALVQVIKRSAADTGTLTAMTKVPLNSGNAAATATVGTYAANPTLGATVGTIAAGELSTVTAASTTVGANQLVFDFTNQQVVLNGAAETLALNANGASFTSGAAINCTIEWSEG